MTSHVMPGWTWLTFVPLIEGSASAGTTSFTSVEWGTPFRTVASLRNVSPTLYRVTVFLL